MSTELIVICGRCRSAIEGDTGFLGVRHRLISEGTIVDGVDTQWDHDTRILKAMFTDPEPAPKEG